MIVVGGRLGSGEVSLAMSLGDCRDAFFGVDTVQLQYVFSML